MITIRPATLTEDWAAVAQLYLTTWQVAYRHLIPQAYLNQLTPQTWHPQTRWQHTAFALSQARIVGVVSAGAARDPAFASAGELYSLYVLPAFHHRGIGQHLLMAGLAMIAQYRQQYLAVLADNVPAQQLYESVGFQDTGQRRITRGNFGQFTTEIWMRTNFF